MMDIEFKGAAYRIERHPNPKYAHSSVWTFQDEQTTQERCWNVAPGDVVLDVGACFGAYTLPALALGAAKVIAIEPVPDCADWLEHLLSLNPGFAERCTIVRLGLSEREKTALIQEDLIRHGALRAAEDTEYRGTVSFARLDDLLSGIPRLDWIKMDTEGGEADILAGGRSVISRCRPRMLLEDHTRCLQAIPWNYSLRVEQTLLDLGYGWEHFPHLIQGADGGRDFWFCQPSDK